MGAVDRWQTTPSRHVDMPPLPLPPPPPSLVRDLEVSPRSEHQCVKNCTQECIKFVSSMHPCSLRTFTGAALFTQYVESFRKRSIHRQARCRVRTGARPAGWHYPAAGCAREHRNRCGSPGEWHACAQAHRSAGLTCCRCLSAAADPPHRSCPGSELSGWIKVQGHQDDTAWHTPHLLQRQQRAGRLWPHHKLLPGSWKRAGGQLATARALFKGCGHTHA